MKSKNQNRIDAIVFRAIGLVCATAGFIVRSFDRTMQGNPMLYFDALVALLTAISFGVLTALSAITVKNEGSTGDSPTYSFPVHATLIALSLFDTVAFWAISSWLVVPRGFLLTPSNILIHIFTPLVAVIDWIMLVPHGKYGLKKTPFTLVFPAIYYIMVMIVSKTGYVYFKATFGEFYRRVVYPYFFLQPDLVGGYVAVAFIAAAFALGAYLFGMIVFALDNILSSDKNEEKYRPAPKKKN